MRRWDLLRCVFTIGLAAAVLVGCGRTQLPIGAAGAMPPTLATGSARTAHISTLRGWMSPDRKKTKRLLYVSEVFTPRGVVDVFSTVVVRSHRRSRSSMLVELRTVALSSVRIAR